MNKYCSALTMQVSELIQTPIRCGDLENFNDLDRQLVDIIRPL